MYICIYACLFYPLKLQCQVKHTALWDTVLKICDILPSIQHRNNDSMVVCFLILIFRAHSYISTYLIHAQIQPITLQNWFRNRLVVVLYLQCMRTLMIWLSSPVAWEWLASPPKAHLQRISFESTHLNCRNKHIILYPKITIIHLSSLQNQIQQDNWQAFLNNSRH